MQYQKIIDHKTIRSILATKLTVQGWPTFFKHSIHFSNDTGQHGVQDVSTINEWLTEFNVKLSFCSSLPTLTVRCTHFVAVS
jgi:hypothetical protein